VDSDYVSVAADADFTIGCTTAATAGQANVIIRYVDEF
jgi:hypothetical protein